MSRAHCRLVTIATAALLSLSMANYAYTHTTPHTHTCTHPHFLQMPISAEQWRAAVGAANASRRPYQPKHRLPWDVFMLIITALLVSTLLPGGGGRGTGSRSEFWNMVNMVRGGQKCWSTAAYTSNFCPKATHYSVVSACDVILHEFGCMV